MSTASDEPEAPALYWLRSLPIPSAQVVSTLDITAPLLTDVLFFVELSLSSTRACKEAVPPRSLNEATLRLQGRCMARKLPPPPIDDVPALMRFCHRVTTASHEAVCREFASPRRVDLDLPVSALRARQKRHTWDGDRPTTQEAQWTGIGEGIVQEAPFTNVADTKRNMTRTAAQQRRKRRPKRATAPTAYYHTSTRLVGGATRPTRRAQDASPPRDGYVPFSVITPLDDDESQNVHIPPAPTAKEASAWRSAGRSDAYAYLARNVANATTQQLEWQRRDGLQSAATAQHQANKMKAHAAALSAKRQDPAQEVKPVSPPSRRRRRGHVATRQQARGWLHPEHVVSGSCLGPSDLLDWLRYVVRLTFLTKFIIAPRASVPGNAPTVHRWRVHEFMRSFRDGVYLCGIASKLTGKRVTCQKNASMVGSQAAARAARHNVALALRALQRCDFATVDPTHLHDVQQIVEGRPQVVWGLLRHVFEAFDPMFTGSGKVAKTNLSKPSHRASTRVQRETKSPTTPRRRRRRRPPTASIPSAARKTPQATAETASPIVLGAINKLCRVTTDQLTRHIFAIVSESLILGSGPLTLQRLKNMTLMPSIARAVRVWVRLAPIAVLVTESCEYADHLFESPLTNGALLCDVASKLTGKALSVNRYPKSLPQARRNFRAAFVALSVPGLAHVRKEADAVATSILSGCRDIVWKLLACVCRVYIGQVRKWQDAQTQTVVPELDASDRPTLHRRPGGAPVGATKWISLLHCFLADPYAVEAVAPGASTKLEMDHKKPEDRMCWWLQELGVEINSLSDFFSEAQSGVLLADIVAKTQPRKVATTGDGPAESAACASVSQSIRVLGGHNGIWQDGKKKAVASFYSSSLLRRDGPEEEAARVAHLNDTARVVPGLCRNPKTEKVCRRNIDKALCVLRTRPNMNRRYLWNVAEIYQGSQVVVFGLLRDIYRCDHGLPPLKEAKESWAETVVVPMPAPQPRRSPPPMPLRLGESCAGRHDSAVVDAMTTAEKAQYVRVKESLHMLRNKAAGTKRRASAQITGRGSMTRVLFAWLRSLGIPSVNERVLSPYCVMTVEERALAGASKHDARALGSVFCSGELLCDIVEWLFRVELPGVCRRTASRGQVPPAAALHNVSVALETLKSNPRMALDNLWNAHHIVSNNTNAIRALLFDVRTATQ